MRLYRIMLTVWILGQISGITSSFLLPDPTFVTSLYGIPLAHNSHALSNSSAVPVGLRSHLGSKNN